MNLSKGYLLVLVGLFAVLSWLLVVPFLQYVLLGILIAYILYPLQTRLESHTSPTIAALTLVIVAIAGFLIPFIVVVGVVAEDAVALVENVDPEAIEISEIELVIEDHTGQEIDVLAIVTEAAQELGSAFLSQWTQWLGAVTRLLIGLGLSLFLIYYLLKDGGSLRKWIREITPLPGAVQDDLFEELDDVTRAVLVGHVLIAIIEGSIAGIGLFVTGIPNAAFWTFVMIILSLIPLIGAFLVWGPAVVYLFLTGEPVLAVGLFVYSAIVVGIADDYLRPIVVDRYAELNPAVIILGVLGGVYAFGIMGLFFGPVILGAFKATITVVDDHYHRLEEPATND